MNARRNDIVRWCIGWVLVILGAILHVRFLFRIYFYRANQKRLKRKYKISNDLPIHSSLTFDPNQDGVVAETSGSTNEPKKLLYTKRRLRWTMFQFVDVFARAYTFLRPRRKSLFIFSSLSKDNSLTSFLLNSPAPNWLSALQAPYRLLDKPAFAELISRYDLDNVRLFILTITNPGVLYSTNPSTLFVFFETLEKHWTEKTRLIRDYYNKPHLFSESLHREVHRNSSTGCRERLKRISASRHFLPIEETMPGMELYSCWTGGYVQPFLTGLEKYLPKSKHRLLPMYSMSTETIETITDCSLQEPVFLPLARGVFYEFIELGKEDSPENLVEQLEPGKTYAMVVSDQYGLKRYQTGDLFECRGIHRGLPNLHFSRRRNLEYSFTGEKITAEQLALVYSQLRSQFSDLSDEDFLTCIPSKPNTELPHFNLVVVGQNRLSSERLAAMASQAEQALSSMNSEYASKVQTHRLNPIQCFEVTMDLFMRRMAGPDQAQWKAQFKILPLYQKLWESCELN